MQKSMGLFFPSSEIYDGLSYCLWLRTEWSRVEKRTFVNSGGRQWFRWMKISLVLTPRFLHPTTWKASGHVDAFNDPLVDNKDSKKIPCRCAHWRSCGKKLKQRFLKKLKRPRTFWWCIQWRSIPQHRIRGFSRTNKRLMRSMRFKSALEANNLEEVRQIILDLEIVCPISGTRNWTDVRQFNLMFSTQVGSVSEEASTIYLRPETAQGIFVNFLNVQKTGRMKIPFGIACRPEKRFKWNCRPTIYFPHAGIWTDGNAVFSSSRELKWNGILTGKKRAWNGIVLLVFRKTNNVFMIISNSRIMPMQRVILNLNFHLVSRNWKEFTHERILTLAITKIFR